MKYNQLKVKSHKKAKRVGRGIAGGQGKTAGRGTKGQNARSGGGVRPGFEGGQNPLTQRLPKLRGFRSARPAPEVVYTSQLSGLKAAVVDNFSLHEAGLVSSPHVRVKLLTDEPLSKKLTVKLQGASASAATAIEKIGGSFTTVPQVKREKTAKNKQA